MTIDEQNPIKFTIDGVPRDPDELVRLLREKGINVSFTKGSSSFQNFDPPPSSSASAPLLSSPPPLSSPTMSSFSDHLMGSKHKGYSAISTDDQDGGGDTPGGPSHYHHKTSFWYKLWSCFLCPSFPPDSSFEGDFEYSGFGQFTAVTISGCCFSYNETKPVTCCFMPGTQNISCSVCVGHWGEKYIVPSLCCLPCTPLPCCWFKVKGDLSSDLIEVNGVRLRRCRS